MAVATIKISANILLPCPPWPTLSCSSLNLVSCQQHCIIHFNNVVYELHGCETPQRSCVLCCTVVGTGSEALNPFIHHKAAKVYSMCCVLCIVVSSLETLIARPSPQLSSLALQFTNSHSSHCREAMQSSDDRCGMRTVIVITWQSQYHCSIIIQPLTYLQFSQTLFAFS